MIPIVVSRVLKGIAILIIIFSHYTEWIWLDSPCPALTHAISTWGPQAVSVFFLFSGYGLYKSAEKNNGSINLRFFLKRILAVYLPYLILSLIIEIYTGGFRQFSISRLINIISASDYWYICVLLHMYLAFMLTFRFGGKYRITLLTIALMIQFIYLNISEHHDFWTLSNPAFLLGVYAAAAEKKWDLSKRTHVKLILLFSGIAGASAGFLLMQACGGSGSDEAYGAELILTLFFTLAVLGAAYLLPAKDIPVLTKLGDVSLFIYILHTVFFYAIILRLEKLTYASSIIITALITLICCAVIGTAYQFFSKKMIRMIEKRSEKNEIQ